MYPGQYRTYTGGISDDRYRERNYDLAYAVSPGDATSRSIAFKDFLKTVHSRSQTISRFNGHKVGCGHCLSNHSVGAQGGHLDQCA